MPQIFQITPFDRWALHQWGVPRSLMKWGWDNKVRTPNLWISKFLQLVPQSPLSRCFFQKCIWSRSPSLIFGLRDGMEMGHVYISPMGMKLAQPWVAKWLDIFSGKKSHVIFRKNNIHTEVICPSTFYLIPVLIAHDSFSHFVAFCCLKP